MWLRSARFDLAWLMVPMIAVLLLLPLDEAGDRVIVSLGLAALFLSGVQIAGNWKVLYREVAFYRFDNNRSAHRRRVIMIGSVLLSIWDLSLFMSVYVYWGLWHFARQHWGIAMLYKVKAQERLPHVDRVDKWVVHALLFLPLLVKFARPGTFDFYMIELYRFHLPHAVAVMGTEAWWTLLGAWLLYCGYRYLTGRLVVPFFLTALCSIVSLASIYWLAHHFLLICALISIPHSFQYIGLASLCNDGKNTRAGLIIP
jgi:hypothetical protein